MIALVIDHDIRETGLAVDHTILGFNVWCGSVVDMPRAHSHEEVELNFLLEGSLEYWLGSGTTVLPLRRLVAFWAGIPHRALAVAPGTRLMWATVPLASVISWRLPGLLASLMQGTMVTEAASPPGSDIADEVMFRRWIRDIERDRSRSVVAKPGARRIEDGIPNNPGSAAAAEVEARFRRLAEEIPARAVASGPCAGGRDAERFERVVGYIHKHFREPQLSRAEIASSVSANPDYLTTWFRTQTGMPLWEYVITLRLSHAQRLLLVTDLPILQIAYEAGFGSASNFYEAFQRRRGLTPRAYRELGGVIPDSPG